MQARKEARKTRKSTSANCQSLIEESTRAKLTARDTARLERQKKLAEYSGRMGRQKNKEGILSE
ncbi:hypothetical protein SCLCIDRAFT_1223631 [Scleroderma citrinum Foug A]|uniref:Uncharacterized protein n=1 Tax=Scleroderma citrinum Foug A TaxID=1036808 RepID=A0A0C3D853_9AGAM|nr:hypothetical protein SCLCIDRAFT_1223631 [Scleroderma citrinum Foug A]